MLSQELLYLKLKIEHALNKYEECLKTANIIIFNEPGNYDAHFIKLKTYKQ